MRPTCLTGVACVVVALMAYATPAQQGGEDVINIGSRLELFVDDYLTETMDGVTRELHSPESQEVAIAYDEPWEGGASAYVTLFQDEDIYRMYYRGLPMTSFEDYTFGTGVICYAESEDGITWTKPNLGIVECEGTKDNNIVWLGTADSEGGVAANFSVFRDPNPACPPDQRYKGVGGYPLHAIASADGLHWALLAPDPVMTEGAFDTQNVAFYDTLRGEYRAYIRDGAHGVRTVRTCTSPDFINWTTPEWCQYGDTQWEHLYTNATIPYFRAPHIFLSFPKRFVPARTRAGYPHPGLSDGIFMSSRDGLNFDRSFMEGWIRPGLDINNWVERNNMPAWGILQTGPEEISVYWVEHYENENLPCQLRRGTLRLDGFVSVNAAYAGGEFTTKPLTFEGRELLINYSTSAVGSVQAEIQDTAGNPMEGFTLGQCPEIFGDEIEHVVAWEGGTDVSALAGQPVRLRFVMKDADLYSVRFRP